MKSIIHILTEGMNELFSCQEIILSLRRILGMIMIEEIFLRITDQKYRELQLNLSNGLTSDMSIEFKNDLIIEPAKVKEFAFAYQSACEDGDHWNVVTTDVYEVLPMEKYSASLHSFLKTLNVSCKPKNQGFHILGFHLESPQNYEYDLTDESCTISGIR